METPKEHLYDQEKFKQALIKFYLKKYPGKNINDAGAFAEFIFLMLGKINTDCTENPLKILTLSYNLKDGIGDFVNQVDFTSWLHEVFDRYQSIQIKALSIIEAAKFNVAQRLMPDNVKQATVVTVKEEKELANIKEDTGNILLSYEVGASSLKAPVIQDMVGSAEYVINLARYIHFHKELEQLLSQCQPTAFVQSRGEYGPIPNEPYSAKLKIDKKIYYETCMGAATTTTGLKFYPNIEALCVQTSSDLEKAKLLEQFENTNLRDVLTKNPLEYMKNHGFAFGYIQEKKYSILFSRLMIAKSRVKEKGVTMIVNLSHFDDLQSNKELMNQLMQEGYSHIRMVANDGSEKPVLSINENPRGKVLTLVEFKGTSQPDKEKMIAMSDMVAGSGNSSFSEMLSSRKFPFIQPIYHVYMFYYSFINEIPNHVNNHQLLKDYLSLNITLKLKENDIQDLIRMISTPEISEAIQQAWTEYCNFLEKNRNAYDDFVELICAFTVTKMMELYEVNACNQLETYFGSGMSSLAGTTLLHMAIEKGLESVVIELIKTHPELINTICIHRNYTPLMMAIRYKQYALVELLIQKGALLNSIDSEGLTVAHHAIITQDLKTFVLLSNYDSSLFAQKDNNGLTPLDYLSPRNNLEYIGSLLRKDKLKINFIDVANTAIHFNSTNLFEMSCEQASAKKRTLILKEILKTPETARIYLPIYLDALQEPVNFKILYSVLSPFIVSMFPESELNKLKLQDHREQTDLQLSLLDLSDLQEKISQGNNLEPYLKKLLDPNAPRQGIIKNPKAHEAIWKLSWACYEQALNDFSVPLPEKTVQKLECDLLKSKIFFYLEQHLVNCKHHGASGMFHYVPNFISSKENREKKIAQEIEKVKKIKSIIYNADSIEEIKDRMEHKCSKYLTDPLARYFFSKMGSETKTIDPDYHIL